MKYVAIIAALFLLPTISHASVQVSEVAWMGIAGTNGQYGEWVELYNNGSEPVDLAGWQLAKDGGTKPLFTLTKTIPAGGYLLVERTTASVPDPVPGIDDEAGTFGSNGLSNEGEHLVLMDANKTVVDDLSYASGWPAGDAATKKTMQLRGSGWITAAATPGAVAGVAVEDESEDKEEEGTKSTNAKAVATSGVKKERAVMPKNTVVPHLEYTFPAIAYKGLPYSYAVAAVLEYGLHAEEGEVVWNMGDGTVVRQPVRLPVSHVYRYPGTYTVSVAFYPVVDEVLATTPSLTGMKTIAITVPTITLAAIEEGSAVQLTNDSSTAIDLSGWQISTPLGGRIFPDMTILSPKTSITIAADALGLATVANAVLKSPDGATVAGVPSIEPAAVERDEKSNGVVKTVRASSSKASRNSSVLEIAPEDIIPLAATATEAFAEGSAVVQGGTGTSDAPTESRTRMVILSAALLFVIGLFILLERTKVRQE